MNLTDKENVLDLSREGCTGIHTVSRPGLGVQRLMEDNAVVSDYAYRAMVAKKSIRILCHVGRK